MLSSIIIKRIIKSMKLNTSIIMDLKNISDLLNTSFISNTSYLLENTNIIKKRELENNVYYTYSKNFEYLKTKRGYKFSNYKVLFNKNNKYTLYKNDKILVRKGDLISFFPFMTKDIYISVLNKNHYYLMDDNQNIIFANKLKNDYIANNMIRIADYAFEYFGPNFSLPFINSNLEYCFYDKSSKIRFYTNINCINYEIYASSVNDADEKIIIFRNKNIFKKHRKYIYYDLYKNTTINKLNKKIDFLLMEEF